MSIERGRRAWLPGCLAALALSGCGGGGGGAQGDGARFVTADPRGLASLAGGGAPLGLEAPGAGAAEGAAAVAREIAEADLLRVDGDRLLLLNAHRGFVVVDLASVRVLGRLALPGYPHEMFVRGTRAFAFVSGFDGASSLVEVSTSDPASPSEVGRRDLGGGYRASRLVGDVLYVATDGEVLSFAVAGPTAEADRVALPHPAAFVHASDALLVVAGPGDGTTTPLTLVDVSDPAGGLALRATIEVVGSLSDEWKMDLAGDVLRVVSHDGTDGGLSHLATFDVSDPDAPAALGSLDLARGEQLFATRFSPEAAYVVTFEQVDPLWVIDLRDPAAPAVSGSLEVPGWSTHLVPAGGGRLVAVGVDPSDGWRVTASLFDVSDPAAPALADRADLGPGWSSALYDRKALGVFPDAALVLLPVSGDAERVAVLDLGAASLDLRGWVDLDGVALRGFPHPRGLVAASSEEVVVVDPASLAVRGRCTVAENVVDACRLPDGTLLPLVARARAGRLGDVDLPLVPSRLHLHGVSVAVVGWDDLGRAAYVVDFSSAPPRRSERFDLGGGWVSVVGALGAGTAVPGGATLSMTPMPWWGGESREGVLTEGGRLVVPGVARADESADGSADGFVVIDVAASRLDDPIAVAGGWVTGFAADGEALVYTVGEDAGPDPQGRPRLRHDLVRVDLATRAASAPANVPGYVVAAEGDLVFAVEEVWQEDWTWSASVVGFAVDPAGLVQATDRLALPEGAYDLRAAGGTLWFATTTDPGSVGSEPPRAFADVVWGGPGGWLPVTRIGNVRLGPALSLGPAIEDDRFRTLLLPEDGSALAVRDGVVLERFDVSAGEVSGLAAVLLWEETLGAYPVAARPDGAGGYLVALGYAGLVTAP